MKKILAVMLVCASLASLPMDADAARRFGGGGSVGRAAPTFSQKAPAPAPAAAPRPSAQPQQGAASRNAAQTPSAQRPSMMRSILTGLAAGLGISALLSMLGFGGGGLANLLTGLLLVGAIVLAVSFFLRRRRASRVVYSDAAPSWRNEEQPQQNAWRQEVPPSGEETVRGGSVMDEFSRDSVRRAHEAQDAGVADVTPDDFDREGFLKVARENYIEFQKAWDTGHVTKLSSFVTDDLFIKVTHELAARGDVDYETKIIDLHNELVGIAQQGDDYVAVVHFSGKLDISGEEERVDDDWVLVKPVNGTRGWLLAGISARS